MQSPKQYSPQEMAGAQGAATREAIQTGAVVNNTNQQSPFGSVNYSIAGYETIKDANGNDVQVPRYNQTTTLSEGQQGLLDRTTAVGTKGLDLASGQIDRLGTTLNQPFSTSGLPAANAPRLNTGPSGAQTTNVDTNLANARTGVGPSDFSQDRLNVENAILSRVEPQFQRDEAAMRTRLANQGLMPGAEASNADLDTLNRARNDARMQAVLAGGQEQSRQFQNQLNQGNFFNQATGQNNAANIAGGQFDLARNAQNNATRLASQQAQNAALGDQYGMNLTGRQNALQEQLTTRNQPINEISALMSGGQVTVPNFQQPYRQGVETTNIAGMMGEQNKQNMQNYYNNMTGMFGLGTSILGAAGSAGGFGALFGLSDKRAKKNITRVGETDEGLPIYRYQYKKGVGGNGMFALGVMAQEVAKTKPDAVMTGPDGLMRVDYGKVA